MINLILNIKNKILHPYYYFIIFNILRPRNVTYIFTLVPIQNNYLLYIYVYCITSGAVQWYRSNTIMNSSTFYPSNCEITINISRIMMHNDDTNNRSVWCRVNIVMLSKSIINLHFPYNNWPAHSRIFKQK